MTFFISPPLSRLCFRLIRSTLGRYGILSLDIGGSIKKVAITSKYYYYCYCIHYIIITFATVILCYGLICTSVTDFLRGHIRILTGRYGSVTHPSEVTVYANSEIEAQRRLYGAILIVIHFIIYKLCIFSPTSGFELGLIKLKRRIANQLGQRGKKFYFNNNNTCL